MDLVIGGGMVLNSDNEGDNNNDNSNNLKSDPKKKLKSI